MKGGKVLAIYNAIHYLGLAGLKQFAQKMLDLFSETNVTIADNSSRLSNRIQDIQNTTASLSARIDSIAGSVTQDSEVLDARVDHEGRSHSVLGENVRSTQSRLSSFSDQIRNEIQPQIDNISNAMMLLVTELAKSNERSN